MHPADRLPAPIGLTATTTAHVKSRHVPFCAPTPLALTLKMTQLSNRSRFVTVAERGRWAWISATIDSSRSSSSTTILGCAQIGVSGHKSLHAASMKCESKTSSDERTTAHMLCGHQRQTNSLSDVVGKRSTGSKSHAPSELKSVDPGEGYFQCQEMRTNFLTSHQHADQHVINQVIVRTCRTHFEPSSALSLKECDGKLFAQSEFLDIQGGHKISIHFANVIYRRFTQLNLEMPAPSTFGLSEFKRAHAGPQTTLLKITCDISEIHSFANKFGFARDSNGTQLNLSF
ncbi:hypothetical protein CLF_105332 [Clonorchis sinensis]|uniref:Uncharacterized protein n=1 Tax=Clonorchis sinensis TaxID=79923 RepID=G7YDE6_CLOSI|nr:hypothetical protein CLF_105332 [Clonorchis sinensis]